MNMTRVIFVRHGQTVWNVEAKYQGHSDIELTQDGIEQAKLVAARLSNEKIAAVYSSDLSRAFKTAEIIAAKHQFTVTALPELREIKFGEWEGLTYGNIYNTWPEVMDQLFTKPDEVKIPGGETFRELKARASEAIENLITKHPNETIVIVSHGGTIRTLICAALNIHLNYLWNIKQDNTAVNIIDYYENRAIVTLLNDTHHLSVHYNKKS